MNATKLFGLASILVVVAGIWLITQDEVAVGIFVTFSGVANIATVILSERKPR